MIPHLEVCKICKHLNTFCFRQGPAYACGLRRKEQSDTSCVIAVNTTFCAEARVAEACPYILEQVLHAE